MQKERFRKGVPSASSQYLTFADICPTWASRLRTGLDKKDIKTLEHDSKYLMHFADYLRRKKSKKQKDNKTEHA